MMARLLTNEVTDPSTPPQEGMCESPKPQHVSARKLSFKTRHASARGNYRATKVSLSSTNVALIASKFNTIVVEEGAQSRALLRKLSSKQRRPSSAKDVKPRPSKARGEGVVKAAIEIFEQQDSEQHSKLPFKRGSVTRPKLVVVTKSSIKSSARPDDSQTIEMSENLDQLSKESAKDINNIRNEDVVNTTSTDVDLQRVKRKPSLKAKPSLRHIVTKRQTLENAYNQRIAKSTNNDANSKLVEKPLTSKDVRKPTFNLNDRILQFSQTDEVKRIENVKNSINKNEKQLTYNKINPTVPFDEKENVQDLTKPILRNNKVTQSVVGEKSKVHEPANLQKNTKLNQQKKSILKTETNKKQEGSTVSKSKINVRENERLFENITKDNSNEVDKLSPLRNTNEELDKTLPQHLKYLNTTDANSKKSVSYAELTFSCPENQNTLQQLSRQFLKSEQEPVFSKLNTPVSSDFNQTKSALPKDSCVRLKPSLKQYSSESPKLEKKNFSLAPDPDNLPLDSLKPNNSFLWKPPSKMSMIVTEVPIYDDRPGSENNDNISINETAHHHQHVNKDNESKTANSLKLDVASSFILEMTEQIERRFNGASEHEDEPKQVNHSSPQHHLKSTGESNENVSENPSFLHRKIRTDDECTNVVSALQTPSSGVKSNQNEFKTSKTPPPVSKKPAEKVNADDSPPQLPEKRQHKLADMSENNETTVPPPIPPSHTKPKLKLTLSEEEWLNNCKKILEIPPPLRKHTVEDKVIEPHSKSTTVSLPRGMSLLQVEQSLSITNKRFSVSQVDLMKRMDEMNLGNKNTSPDSRSISNSYIEIIEDDDHYSSIPAFERIEVDDQNTYEAIGDENNYEVIQEYVDGSTVEAEEIEGEVSNIYDDVVGQEDHYEAINNASVQGDSDSSCDQSNSLYGVTRPGAMAVKGDTLQVTGGSETSDEWMDMDNSDDNIESVFIVHKERNRSLAATESWSMKVRRHWSNKAAKSDMRISSNSILYVSGASNEQCNNSGGFNSCILTDGTVSLRTQVCLCNQYEAQEVVAFLESEDGSDKSVPRSYENIENAEESPHLDDFDSLSDSSFENEAFNPNVQVADEKKTQPITEGIYGLMKQAGQRMRKHWSIGKSLTRMGKNKSTGSNFFVGSALTESLDLSFAVPVPVPIAADLGRRGWSFKSKDKPLTAQSTFYLHSKNTLSRTGPQLEHREPKVDPRRLSTSSMIARPTSPPPPPPPRISLDESIKRKSDLNSSNNSSTDTEGYVEGQRRLSRNGNSTWYLDTSTDSASEHGSSQGSDLNLKFADEPLYQFYAANIAEMTLSQLSEGDSDGYEEITPSPCPLPAPLDLVAVTHHRSLWCELPQVRNTGLLDTLTQAQKRLQEAKFEVMTSEASYFKSLTVLDKLFASCPLFSDENILSRDERKILFGNVNAVRKCSEKLLAALQSCWQESILLQGICDVIHDHVKTYREVYVKYCTNQISLDRTLKALKQANSNFGAVLAQLEREPECQSLALYSFLMLPMQRITRLRLLIETMLSILDQGDSEYTSCQKALDILNKCVGECNEGARSQERMEEMVRLSKQLDFPPETSIPILDQGRNRWLVRSGQMTHVNMDAKQTFGRRLSRTGPKFTLFLFTDLLLLTKKKSEECYVVVDHCQRSLLEATEMRDFPGNNRFLLSITLLENAENKTVEMTLSCENESDRQRWLQVLRPPQSQDPEETLYEDWDCPQVTAVHNYRPDQPDELPLAMGDIVNVLRKSEGWFYGERTRDGEKGWFPGNYSREIASKHVRARNLKQRHRLLQLSADLVQQQRKVKS